MKNINSNSAGVSLQLRPFRIFYKETSPSFRLGYSIIIFYLLLSILFISSATAEEINTQAQAEAILKYVNRPVGLVHIPDCGEGELALALLEADKTLRIHAQDPDYKKIQAARKKADEKAYYGKRAWFDQGDTKRLLPVGNSCDLIIMTNLEDKNLTPELAKEISRVLHPWYGIALLTGNVPKEKLAQWGEHFKVSGVRVQVSEKENSNFKLLTSNFPGFLLKAEKPHLPGADDWPLWWHGADNNCVSEDKAFRLPSTIQWTGKPFTSTRIELPIIAQGRLFMVWNGHLLDMTPGEPLFSGEKLDLQTQGWKTIIKGTLEDHRGPLLTAQTTGNGSWLWSKRLSPAAWLQVARSMLAACGGVLLVTDGNVLLELDQGTGEELRRKEMNFDEIKWLSVSGEYILLLGGGKLLTENPGSFRRSEKNVVPFRSSGEVLIVLERTTLKTLWEVKRGQGENAFDPRSPAADNGKIFICTEGGTAEAFELDTGKLAWENKLGFERKKPGGYEWDRSSRHPVSGYAAENVYVISGIEMQEAFILSQKDGSELWKMSTKGQRQFIPLAYNGVLSDCDPQTGIKKKEKIVYGIKESCSRPTAAPFSLEKGYSPPESMKSACGPGNYVADGLLWKFPGPCSNCMEWRGFLIQAPREKVPALSKRLYVSGSTAVSDSKPKKGWLTYRGNAQRSSFVSSTIPEEGSIQWTVKPFQDKGPYMGQGVNMDAGFVPAPPVVAGSLVVVAHADGSVNGMDLETGKQLWRSYTSGRIHSSPSIWKDRVFVSSCDGYLYAFALEDGREIWRLRVSEKAGRAMVYDQLGSRWPAVSSPVVSGDTVIASAGLVGHIDGVHMVCAKAETGKIIWDREDWSEAEEGGKISGGAQFALANDTAVYHGGMAPPVEIDTKDGSAGAVLPETLGKRLGKWHNGKWKTIKAYNQITSSVKGQDAGFLSRDFVVYGGRRPWIDEKEGGTARQNLKILARNEKGEGLLPVFGINGTVLMPAWDDNEIMFISAGVTSKNKRITGPVCVSKEKLFSAFNEITSKQVTEEILAMDDIKPKGAVSIPENLLRQGFSILEKKLETWKRPLPYGSSVITYALTENAVVLLISSRGVGRIEAVDRKANKKLWTVNLPARPTHYGLAVASDGTVVVACVDGTVLAIGNADTKSAELK